MFNLPVLAKEMCEQLLEVQGEQLDSFGGELGLLSNSKIARQPALMVFIPGTVSSLKMQSLQEW